jgi:hypothetical protein
MSETKKYQVPQREELLFHVEIEIRQFSPVTGKKISTPRIQKFGMKAWEGIKKELEKQSYTIEILHDPNVWLAEQHAKEAAEKIAAEKAEKEANKK